MLTQCVEPAVIDAFAAALRAGADNEVIEGVAAHSTMQLAGTDEVGRQAWRSIEPNVDV